MVKTFRTDEDLHKRFVDAVSKAHWGHPHGNITYEHDKALEDRIKKLETQK